MSTKTSEKENFTKIVEKQYIFLCSIRKHGKKVLQEHRSLIIGQLRSWLYDAYLSKTLTYSEFKELSQLVRDTLSWENLVGVKQLTVFDEIPDFNPLSYE